MNNILTHCPVCSNALLPATYIVDDNYLDCPNLSMDNSPTHNYWQSIDKFYLHIIFHQSYYIVGREKDYYFVDIGSEVVQIAPFHPVDCLEIINKTFNLKAFL